MPSRRASFTERPARPRMSLKKTDMLSGPTRVKKPMALRDAVITDTRESSSAEGMGVYGVSLPRDRALDLHRVRKIQGRKIGGRGYGDGEVAQRELPVREPRILVAEENGDGSVPRGGRALGKLLREYAEVLALLAAPAGRARHQDGIRHGLREIRDHNRVLQHVLGVVREDPRGAGIHQRVHDDP
jgi:hypothetical protein